MPKTFAIRLEVEEVALGSVIRRLNELAGVAKIDVDLGMGGTRSPMNGGRGSAQDTVLAMLADGPQSVKALQEAVGGGKSRTYGVTHQLRRKKLIKAVGKGMYALTAAGAAGHQTNGAAPPKTPTGRVKQGVARDALFAALNGKGLSSNDMRASLSNSGVPTGSVQGVIHRAKRDGLIKKNGQGLYALTAKGEKAQPANG